MAIRLLNATPTQIDDYRHHATLNIPLSQFARQLGVRLRNGEDALGTYRWAPLALDSDDTTILIKQFGEDPLGTTTILLPPDFTDESAITSLITRLISATNTPTSALKWRGIMGPRL
jgi:hypothetical protein